MILTLNVCFHLILFMKQAVFKFISRSLKLGRV